jgi:hypothetical protein
MTCKIASCVSGCDVRTRGLQVHFDQGHAVIDVSNIDLRFVSPHRPVTVPQAFKMLHLALEELGLPYPQNRREASALIGELQADAEE